MATLHCIAFFLACVFLLQEIHAQSSSSFELKEEYEKSSSSHQDNESFKKEVKQLEEQTGAVMAEVCEPHKILGVTCELTDIGRRFKGSNINPLMRFVHTPLRVLHGVVTVCGKIAKCIGKTMLGLPTKIINSLPPCLRDIFNEISSFLKTVIEKINEVLKAVFSYAKRVASCLLECAKDIFEQIYSIVVKILKTVLIITTDIVRKVLALAKDSRCPKQNAVKDPAIIIVQCGQCVLCPFKPDTSVCNNQQLF